MNNIKVRITANDNQLLHGGEFTVRNSMIAGVLTHIMSLIMLVASAVLFMTFVKSGEIRLWGLLVAILATLYSMACLFSSMCFNLFGKSINKKLNEITKDECSAWSDQRTISSYEGFTKEIKEFFKQSLYSNELFFVRFHQIIRHVIKNEPLTWLVQFLLSPFILVPHQVSSIFVPYREATAIKIGRETDDVFKLAYMDAKDFVENRFSDEDENFKEIFVTLLCMYNILKRGYVLDPSNKLASKTSAFLEKYNIQMVETLFVGDEAQYGNIDKFVFIISECVARSKNIEIEDSRKSEIASVFKMELGLKYIEEGDDALILSKFDCAIRKSIKGLCAIVLFPLSIISIIVGIYLIRVNLIFVGLSLFGGAITIFMTKYCLEKMGFARFKGFKIISNLYLRKKYREKISSEIFTDIESGVISSEYKTSCDNLLIKLRNTTDEEQKLPLKQKIKFNLHEAYRIIKGI
ncbi:MAG: hypothetical protein WCK10_02180 [Candidatus Staskawiczbacteria bacterium]